MLSSHITVALHLHSLGNLQKYGACVPHDRKKQTLAPPTHPAADSLLDRYHVTYGYKESARLGSSATPTIFKVCMCACT